MAKYDPLERFLKDEKGRQPLLLSLKKIESIIGDELPNSAKNNGAWWGNESLASTRHTQCRAWRRTGWLAFPDLWSERVKFERSPR